MSKTLLEGLITGTLSDYLEAQASEGFNRLQTGRSRSSRGMQGRRSSSRGLSALSVAWKATAQAGMFAVRTRCQDDLFMLYLDRRCSCQQRNETTARNTTTTTNKLGLKVGDPREVDHKRPLSKGGTNGRRNLRAVSRKTNRRKHAKRRA
jgi:hypothetical protein